MPPPLPCAPRKFWFSKALSQADFPPTQSLHGFVHSQGSLPALEDLQMDAPAQSLASEPNSLPHNSTQPFTELHTQRGHGRSRMHPSPSPTREPPVSTQIPASLPPSGLPPPKPINHQVPQKLPLHIQSPPLLSISTAIILGQWLRKGRVPTGPSRSGSAGGVSGYHS